MNTWPMVSARLLLLYEMGLIVWSLPSTLPFMQQKQALKHFPRQYLPLLLQTASAISADWARWQSRPEITLGIKPA